MSIILYSVARIKSNVGSLTSHLLLEVGFLSADKNSSLLQKILFIRAFHFIGRPVAIKKIPNSQ